MGYISDFIVAFGTLLLISSKDIIGEKKVNNSKGNFQMNIQQSLLAAFVKARKKPGDSYRREIS
jgi:hypothetical protein